MSVEALERLGAAEQALVSTTPSKRMLVIVNPYATTVSDRLRNLVVHALRGRYDVHALDTERRGHATQLCREAAQEGYDVVVAFGGDGTVNEAINGLAGSDTPLGVLPGGSTNVFARVLGIPNEIVDATEHLLRLADDWSPRRVDLGRANGRLFTFSAGLGLDASVVERVDSHPHLKSRFGPWYFTEATVSAYMRRYLLRAPRFVVECGEERIESVTTIVQNCTPYTFFKSLPIELAEDVDLASGTLAATVLRRASLLSGPTLGARALTRHLHVARHRQIAALTDIETLRVSTLDERKIPLQLDGDYIGEVEAAEIEIVPRAIRVAA